jgi:hemerythrin
VKKFEWLESFELRVPEIDGDHRAILDLMKAVRAAAARGNRERVEHYVERLFILCRNHFAREEALMQRWGYPEAIQHAGYHSRLLERAEAVRRACAEAPSLEGFEACCDELMTFLVDDVVRGDMKMKSFLEEAGLTVQA